MRFMIILAVTLAPFAGLAQGITDRPGWRVIDTDLAYQPLIDAVKAATEANEMRVVTEAGPTEAAAKLGNSSRRHPATPHAAMIETHSSH